LNPQDVRHCVDTLSRDPYSGSSIRLFGHDLCISHFPVFIIMRTDTDKITLPAIEDVPQDCWAKLAQLKIFFGHQSVGYNIVDGITDILQDCDYIDLNLAETCDPVRFGQPVFAHARVGRNTDPLSKIRSFEEILDSGVGDSVDIAFFKFCYVDIFRDSNPVEIFDNYVATLDRLKNRYPRTKFMHVAVPIRSLPKSAVGALKQCIKSLVGKPGVLGDNVVRDLYNRLLTDTYSGTEPLFDTALAESVNSSGLRCHTGKGSQKVYVMAPEYTDDGGHLNAVGRRRVAEQLLVTLAEIANNP